jgi:hypothetical protein
VAKLEISIPSLKGRKRLLDTQDYAPWIRAGDALNDCTLFWMPVSGFPIRAQEKAWVTEFLGRLSSRLKDDFELRCEIFFRYKQITEELGDAYRAYSLQCMKLTGMGRYANADIPPTPTHAQIKEQVESGKEIDFREWVADFLIWFMTKQPERQRELFLGHGGMLTLFLPTDPKTAPPKTPFTPALRASMPVFQKMDVDGIIAGAFATRDAFLEKSKALFGTDLETRPEYPGIPFVLPMLESGHFFIATEELRTKWFSLFDLYINESIKDKGILLAFQKEQYEDVLLDVLESMRDDGFVYRVE